MRHGGTAATQSNGDTRRESSVSKTLAFSASGSEVDPQKSCNKAGPVSIACSPNTGEEEEVGSLKFAGQTAQ